MNPDWLNRMLIESELNDAEAQIVSWSEFEKRCTLHDSHWVGFISEVGYGGDLVFCLDWDTVWMPKEIKEKFDGETAYLFVKIPSPKTIEFIEFSRVVNSISPIADAVLKNRTLEIMNIYGGKVTINEVDEIGLWLYNERGLLQDLIVEQVALRNPDKPVS